MDDFIPDRSDSRTFKTEYLLRKFVHMVRSNVRLFIESDYGFKSELPELQNDILMVLYVPEYSYYCDKLFDSS